MSIRLKINNEDAFNESQNAIFKTIDRFAIVKKMQNHSLLKVGGFVNFEEQKRLVSLDKLQKKDISFFWCYDTLKSDDYTQLFYGKITQVKLSQRGAEMYCEIEAHSMSSILDLEKKTRVFQNCNKTYKDLFNQIISADHYKKIKFDEIDFLKKQISELIIQYNETDWEFLQRICRRVKAYCFMTGDDRQGKIFFDGGDIDVVDSNYFSITRSSHNEEILLESREIYRLGNRLKFKNKIYTINEVSHQFKNATIYNSYTLKEKDLNSTYSGHPALQGLTLKAKVTDNRDESNKGKIKVEFHQINNLEDIWPSSYYFNVTTPYSSNQTGNNVGFYSIPEVDETVLVEFCSDYEKDCLISGVIREKENELLKDPSQKIWRSSKGREFRINDDEISISSKDEQVFITLSDEIIKCSNEETNFEMSKNQAKIFYQESEILLNKNEIRLQVGNAFIKVNKNGVEINDGKSANIEICNDITLNGSSIKLN